MTKTTLHCQLIPTWAAPALRALGSSWVKLIDPPANTDPLPEWHKDIRLWTDDWDRTCIDNGFAGADEYMAKMLPRWEPYRAWHDVAFELPNEPECNSNFGLAMLSAFTMRCIDIANHQGLRLIVLNLPEGNPHDNGTGDPSVSRWKVQHIVPAVEAAVAGGHIIGLHGYGRPGVEDLTGRYHALRCIDMVQWWAEAGVDVSKLRLALTEWGVDGGIAGHDPVHGWRDLMSRSEYVSWVVAGEAALRTLPWLEFAALFTAGPQAPWWSYEQDEETVMAIADGIGKLTSVPRVRLWHRDTGSVEALSVEEYLRGVVPNEVPASWPVEALKAQAVAARTYTMKAIAAPRHAVWKADLCNTTCCQVWTAYTSPNTDAAILATAGETWPVGDAPVVRPDRDHTHR